MREEEEEREKKNSLYVYKKWLLHMNVLAQWFQLRMNID
jgi:hypothetical protein